LRTITRDLVPTIVAVKTIDASEVRIGGEGVIVGEALTALVVEDEVVCRCVK
jgi:hypothetical protein